MTPQVMKLAQVLWDYNHLEQPAGDADLLLVMGHADLGVPRRAAELMKQYSYKYVVVTGGVYHKLAPTGEVYDGLEGEVFKREMVRLGVPAAQILVEDGAQNTGDNVTMSRALLGDAVIKKGQLVHNPIMRRRAYATAAKQWERVVWQVTSEQIEMQAYMQNRDPERVVVVLVGDTYRILTYPALGFQIEQPMPEEVREALQALIELGYGKNLPDGAKV